MTRLEPPVYFFLCRQVFFLLLSFLDTNYCFMAVNYEVHDDREGEGRQEQRKRAQTTLDASFWP